MEYEIKLGYVLLGIVVYFLPSIINVFTRNRIVGALFAINLMWGWTIIAWFQLFVLASRHRRHDKQ